MSPALAGRFFATEPPGKYHMIFLIFIFIYLFYLTVPVFTATCGIFSCSMWDLVPDQGLNALPSPATPHIGNTRVLATEPPGKSPSIKFLSEKGICLPTSFCLA